MVAAAPALTVNQSLYKALPYNAERDFVPVARGVTVPLVICVPAALGIRTLAELVERGRREPRALTYGSAGPRAANRPFVGMVDAAPGARFLCGPFRGLGMALPALPGGPSHFLAPGVALQ